MMDPTHDGGMSHRKAAFGHYLEQVPETELEAQLPPYAKTMISRSKCRPSNSSFTPGSPAIAPPSPHQLAAKVQQPAIWTRAVSNWTVPNVAAIKYWPMTAGLRLDSFDLYHASAEMPFPHQRLWGTASDVSLPVKERPIVEEDSELIAWKR
jgi:hypothetical protein